MPLSPLIFNSLAALDSASPEVGTPIELSVKRILEMGDGFVTVADNSGASIKVYTTAKVKSADRILSLQGALHTEGSGRALYADDGPSPYFDPQGFIGRVVAAHAGTTAYAATLEDESQEESGSSGLCSVGGDLPNGKWVYLTGQVVSAVDHYFSYDLNPDAWVDVCYVQSLDHTGGFRAYTPESEIGYAGAVVDIMAQLSTKDGQRLLGVIGDVDSIEYKTLYSPYEPTPLPLRPLGMNNSWVSGKTHGSNPGNPGITGATGLYNVGSYVKVWGRVLEYGEDYGFGGGWPTPYIRIDDGAGVPSGGYGGDKGVIVFASLGTMSLNVQEGDLVMATGVSCVWKPSGSATTYRAIWPADNIWKVPDGITGSVADTGSISGTVKLYDMPASTATVHVWLSSGRGTALDITRQSDNSGSVDYEFTNVPKTAYYGGQDLTYTISAQCNGYKTRTYAVTPDETRNLYLVPLRKLYLSTSASSIYGYPNSTPATITAQCKTVDAEGNKIAVANHPVRFLTDTGSFSSTAHQKLFSTTTNSSGVATAYLYGAMCEQSEVSVLATDDSAPLPEDDLLDDPADDWNTYAYDWEKVSPISITSGTMALAANPTTIHPCESDYRSTITATVRKHDYQPVASAKVRFTTDRGYIEEGAGWFTTNSSGQAVVHLRGTGLGGGTATVTAYCDGSGPSITKTTTVTIVDDKLTLTPNYYSVPPGQTCQLTATVTTSTGTPIIGRTVTFSTVAPATVNPTSGQTVGPNGTVSTTLSNVPQGGYAVVEASCDNSCSQGMAQKLQIDFLKSDADDWPQFMHDSRHQGYSRTNDTTTSENLTLAWSASVPTSNAPHAAHGWNWMGFFGLPHPTGGNAGAVFEHPYIDSSPVHASGCPVIVGTWASGNYWNSTGYVVAFDPIDDNNGEGVQVWRYPSAGYIGGVASTACVAEISGTKYAYIGSMDGKLYCLNAQTGAFMWSYQTLNRSGGNGRILASPTVYGSRVYIGNESGRIYCLDAADGDLLWSYDLPVDAWPDSTGVSSAAVAIIGQETSARLFMGCDNGYVYCLSTEDNPQQREAWPTPYYAGACVESSPMVYADKVYVGTSQVSIGNTAYEVVAIDAVTGSFAWGADLDEEARATFAVANGYVYTGVDTGRDFYQLSTKDGMTVNRLTLGFENYFVGSAAISPADLVFVGNDNGQFYALRGANVSNIVASQPTGGIVCSSPAISYAAQNQWRWVYVVSRTEGGRLLAFRTQR